LIGPNCLGLMNPLIGLNATFAQDIARPGNVAFLSQSGALLEIVPVNDFIARVDGVAGGVLSPNRWWGRNDSVGSIANVIPYV